MPPQPNPENQSTPEYDKLKNFELSGPGLDGDGKLTVINGENTRFGLDIDITHIDGLEVPRSFDVAAKIDLGTEDANVILLRDLNEVFGENPTGEDIMRVFLAQPDHTNGSIKLIGEVSRKARSKNGVTIGRELLEHAGSYDEETKKLVSRQHVTISTKDGQAIIHDEVSTNGTQISKKGPHRVI